MTSLTPAGFTLKGKHVLAMLLLFFGTVFAVNFYMARVAILTFSGLEADKAYQDGLKYNDVSTAARQQAERNWTVDAKVASQKDGVVLVLTQRDGAGRPTSDIAMTAVFVHPADRRHDISVDLVPTGNGQFRAQAPVAAGRWDLHIEAVKDAALLFRSVNRIDIAPVM